MGVVNCHNMLMLLAVSKEFTETERDVVIPPDHEVQDGQGGRLARTPEDKPSSTLGDTVGGVASSVCRPEDIMPDGASPGEVFRPNQTSGNTNSRSTSHTSG